MTPAGANILYGCCSTCSQTSKERTNEVRAIAFPLCSRRDQGPLQTSGRASRRSRGKRTRGVIRRRAVITADQYGNCPTPPRQYVNQ